MFCSRWGVVYGQRGFLTQPSIQSGDTSRFGRPKNHWSLSGSFGSMTIAMTYWNWTGSCEDNPGLTFKHIFKTIAAVYNFILMHGYFPSFGILHGAQSICLYFLQSCGQRIAREIVLEICFGAGNTMMGSHQHRSDLNTINIGLGNSQNEESGMHQCSNIQLLLLISY